MYYCLFSAGVYGGDILHGSGTLMMQSVEVFTEVTALIGKEFFARIIKYNNVATVLYKLSHEIGVHCHHELITEVWYLRGDLSGNQLVWK